MIRILINGICGQMGHAIYNAAAESDEFSIAAGVDCAPGAGFDCPVYARFEEVREAFDVIIDFSVPAALENELQYVRARKIPLVIGTTGLTDRLLRQIKSTAELAPVFQTGNMSLGVNLQMSLVRHAAATLGSAFDVEIVERHHRKKVDAPSGTALMLADSIASELPDELEYVYGRHEKNKRRTDHEIGFHSVRGGTIVGEHEVSFIGKDEVVEITHRAYSKRVFAEGALRAAKYLMGKAPGLYNMQNIVTEHDIVSHISSLDGQSVIFVSVENARASFASDVLSCVAAHGVFIDMISYAAPFGTTSSIGFSMPESSLSDALNALHEFFGSLTIHTENNMTKITIEGSGMALRHGIAAKLLSLLNAADISVSLITTSETKIELCVAHKHALAAVSAIEGNFLSEV